MKRATSAVTTGADDRRRQETTGDGESIIEMPAKGSAATRHRGPQRCMPQERCVGEWADDGLPVRIFVLRLAFESWRAVPVISVETTVMSTGVMA